MKSNINKELSALVRPLDFFKPDPKNARAHPPRSIMAIKQSLRDFGQQKPVVALKSGVLVAGNGMLTAAKELDWDGLAVVIFEDEKTAKAYALADNRTAELSEWDFEILNDTLATLKLEDVDTSSLGFEAGDFNLGDYGPEGKPAEQVPTEYSTKIDTPIYTPKGEKPELSALTNMIKATELIQKIKASSLSEQEKAFLIQAASRHISFDYQLIAEYYCHASKEMQELMENSALVIIDFNKAIEQGYVAMTEELGKIYERAYKDEEDDEA